METKDRDTRINFLKSRNLAAGFLSAAVTIMLAYLLVWLVEGVNRGLSRFDEVIIILILIAIGIVFLLFILGPAIYVAAKHGWKAFISVIIVELLIVVLFVILRLVFPFWLLTLYLF